MTYLIDGLDGLAGMLFTTIQFAIFFLFVLALNWLLRERPGPYKVFLFIANVIFYASLGFRFLPLLLVAALANWGFARLIVGSEDSRAKKIWLVVDIVLNLGLLSTFKYTEFLFGLIEPVMLSLGWSGGWRIPEIIYPIGLSFFTFQGLSYIIDVYRNHDRVVENPLDIMLFVSFFPTVLSGPIMRAGHFLPQLTSPTKDPESFQMGFVLILSGLFKKIVVASYLSEHIVRQVFQVPDHYSSVSVLAAVYGYSIQIYCDFSGYSDMAMGMAMLMGFRLPDNFLQPYLAVNLQEFWHRWHISLSTWLRDYLYIPLGGSRRGNKYINLLITMMLGGLWHGAHSRYLIWGTLHGLGLAITHFVRDRLKRRRGSDGENTTRPAWTKWLSWFLTFNAVSLLWVFFRAEDTARALDIIKSLFIWRTGAGFEMLVLPAIFAGLGMQLWGGRLRWAYFYIQKRLPVPLQGLAVGIICIVILKLGPEGVLPFIYFQF